MLILSTTVMSNIFKYIQILLKLLILSHIYKEPLNKPNLIYIMALIRKTNFKNLIFVISSTRIIYNMPKIMICINSINEIIEIVKYLRSRLSKYM